MIKRIKIEKKMSHDDKIDFLFLFFWKYIWQLFKNQNTSYTDAQSKNAE